MDITPKTPETAPMPPDAALIRLARIGAGITIAAAASASKTATSRGVSVPRWNQVEANRETRDGTPRPVHAKPQTIAMMAFGVDRAAGSAVITPERLEAEGQNPAAAIFLAEMLKQEPVSPGARVVPFPSSDVTAQLGPRPAGVSTSAIPEALTILRQLWRLARQPNPIPEDQATGEDLFGPGLNADSWDQLRQVDQLGWQDAVYSLAEVFSREKEMGLRSGSGGG